MAFQQGLSGLNAASKSLDVIGNNIANANTTGFKSSRAEFADMVASAMGVAGGSDAGIGVQVADIAQQFTRGNISTTGNNLDVAIDGGGFFKLQQPDGSMAYTRAGNFQLDKAGNLVTNTNAKVLGYTVDPTTGKPVSGANPVPLVFPTSAPIAAKQTTTINASFNLDARATDAAGNLSATPPIPATPRTTYSTSINAYDSQGVATPVNLYFEKNGANTWDVYDKLDDLTTTPATVPPAAGRMIADKNGKIVATVEPIASSIDNADPTKTQVDDFPKEFTYKFYGPDANGVYAIREAKLTFANATDAWDFTYSDSPTNSLVASARLKSNLIDYATGTPATGGTLSVTALTDAPAAAKQSYELGLMVNPSPANPNSPPATGSNPAPAPFAVTLNLDQVTQYGSSFAVATQSQDGYAAGELTSVNIEDSGMVMATYSNGVTRAEAQLALANFRNPQGLRPIGGNNWVETFESGAPVVGAPGTGSLGALRSGALEDSNVDLTAELVNLMTAQRYYQANAQTIKTQDQVMSTLVNLR